MGSIQLNPHKLYIFDLDGTLYRGKEPIAHAVEVVSQLRKDGAKIAYVTNNSSQTREFYQRKLQEMGFEVGLGEVYSSAVGSAIHLVSNGKKTVFVVGMPGLVRTLEEHGIEVLNRLGTTEATEAAEAVVTGICLDFTYALMAGAMEQILRGAEFVATNADATFPLEGGRLTPGAGSMVAAIQTCSGKAPFVVGKPNPFLIELVLKETGRRPEDALCVGDRMDTDIAAGSAAGCSTHLVLTGVETKAPKGQPFSKDLRALLA